MVLDRVGRIPAYLPLIENHQVFVSALLALCSHHGAEVMLVDDFAERADASGGMQSYWSGQAKNIIRLRRVSFQGLDTTTIELVAAGGRIITSTRPFELHVQKGLDDYSDTLEVEDGFRGYIGLSTGKLERCKLRARQ